MDQMAQLQTRLLLFASSFGSAGGNIGGTFWEGTSSRLPHMVGSHRFLMQPELRAEVLEPETSSGSLPARKATHSPIHGEATEAQVSPCV